MQGYFQMIEFGLLTNFFISKLFQKFLLWPVLAHKVSLFIIILDQCDPLQDKEGNFGSCLLNKRFPVSHEGIKVYWFTKLEYKCKTDLIWLRLNMSKTFVLLTLPKISSFVLYRVTKVKGDILRNSLLKNKCSVSHALPCEISLPFLFQFWE